jgi:hypothetical protein
MMRFAALGAALALFAMPLRSTLMPGIVAAGVVALAIAAIGIATLRRSFVTVAACGFLVDDTVALWVSGESMHLSRAVGVGLALVLLVQAVELARSARAATVDGSVLTSQLTGWMVFATATLASTAVVTLVARALAGAVPFSAAALVAALGALGVITALILGARGTL